MFRLLSNIALSICRGLRGIQPHWDPGYLLSLQSDLCHSIDIRRLPCPRSPNKEASPETSFQSHHMQELSFRHLTLPFVLHCVRWLGVIPKTLFMLNPKGISSEVTRSVPCCLLPLLFADKTLTNVLMQISRNLKLFRACSASAAAFRGRCQSPARKAVPSLPS